MVPLAPVHYTMNQNKFQDKLNSEKSVFVLNQYLYTHKPCGVTFSFEQ